MKKIEKKDIWLFMAQAAVWLIILLSLPLATFLSTQDLHATKTSFFVVWGILQAPLVIYFVNFYILGPFLFFRQKYLFFATSRRASVNFTFILCVLATTIFSSV